MKNSNTKLPVLFLAICLVLVQSVLAQDSPKQIVDSPKTEYHFTGTANMTNNGISLLPSFSLGKPASIVNFSMGNNKFSFDPEYRISLQDMKPWSMIFWFRYKAVNNSRFKLGMGAHPALIFKTVNTITNGINTETLQSQRYLAGELVPNYLINNNWTIGFYYLYSAGLERISTKTTHFITLNTNIANIQLPENFVFRFNPQVYYLQQDNKDGYYYSTSMTLSNTKSPFSLSSILNKEIRSNLNGSKDFIWNVTLTYSFGHNYIKN